MEEFNIEVNVGNSINNIRDMRNELRELRGQMAQAEGEEFVNLSARASELNADLGRTTSLVTSSGSAFTNFNTLLGRTAKSLLTLDFGAAAEQAQALQRVAGQMNFKTLTQGVKQATTAFKGLGKALLANPLFLIAAVVAAVAFAFYKLMEELGLLEPILDAIKKYFDLLLLPIKLLIQGLKDLTDWFGWTSHAADEEAEAQQKAAEARLNASIRANQVIENNLNNEIKLMKAQGATIEEIEDKEIELARQRIKNFMLENKMEVQRLMLKRQVGIATSEELDQLVALESEMNNMMTDLQVLETNIANNREARVNKEIEDNKKAQDKIAEDKKKIAEDSAKFIENLKRSEEIADIQLIDDAIEREQKLALKKLEHKQKDIDFTKMNAEAKLEWDKWYEDEVDRINQEAADKRILKEEEQLQKVAGLQKKYDELIRGEETTEQKIERMQQDHLDELEQLELEYQDKAELYEEFLLNKKILEEQHSQEVSAIQQKQAEDEKKRLKELEKAEEDLAQAKMNAAYGALSVAKTIAGENEKVANVIFAVEQGLAAGELIVNAIKQKGLLAAQLAAGIARSAIDPIGGGAQIAAAKAGMASLATSTAVGLAGIAGATIGKFSAGSINNDTPTPPVMGGGQTPTTQQPSFSNFRDDFAGDITMGGGPQGTYILDSQLQDNEERKNRLAIKRDF